MDNFESVPRQNQPLQPSQPNTPQSGQPGGQGGATGGPAGGSASGQPGPAAGGQNPAVEVRPISASDEVLEGSYATNAVVLSTKEEFMIDFLSTFPPAPRIVARIIVTPSHLVKMLEVWRTALEKHEKHFGPLPELVPNDKPKTQSNAADFYKAVKMPESMYGGTFANGMEISSRKDDFLISFQTSFPPRPRMTARIIVPAGAFKRMVPVVADSLKNFEQRHGPVQFRPGSADDKFTLN